jgi:hypothetical protein
MSPRQPSTGDSPGRPSCWCTPWLRSSSRPSGAAWNGGAWSRWSPTGPGFLSRPNIGRVLRRLYSSAEEYPELLVAYWDRHGRHHWEAMQSTLEQARDQGQLAEDAEIDVIQEMLFGTVLYQLVASHQAPDARQIETSLSAVLRQVGYQTGARRAP